jgi:hypothetical protein
MSINTITRQSALEMGINFDEFLEDFVEDSYSEHRRGSNFYTKSIVEINEELYPEVHRELDGFWETNQYISDTEHGTNWSEINKLTRVIAREKIVKTIEWVPATNV